MPPLRVRTDASSLVERLARRDREIDAFRRRLARLPVQVHEVAYEDLVARQDEVLRGVLSFLDVPETSRSLRSSLVRPTGERALDRIENRDDVVRRARRNAVRVARRLARPATAPVVYAGTRGGGCVWATLIRREPGLWQPVRALV